MRVAKTWFISHSDELNVISLFIKEYINDLFQGWGNSTSSDYSFFPKTIVRSARLGDWNLNADMPRLPRKQSSDPILARGTRIDEITMMTSSDRYSSILETERRQQDLHDCGSPYLSCLTYLTVIKLLLWQSCTAPGFLGYLWISLQFGWWEKAI